MIINNKKYDLFSGLYNPKTMDLLLENKFRFDRKYDMEHCPHIVANEEINWGLVPFGDPEWAYVLNRMDYCVDLCYETEKTGDFKYLKKAKEFIFNYISQDNTPESNPQTRTLDTGIRLMVWDKVIEYLIKEKLLTKNEIEQIKNSFKWQMEYLYTGFIDNHKVSNWGMMQTLGFLTGLKYVDMPREMIEFYEGMLIQHLEIEFFNDGMQWEQSSIYIMEVVERLLQFNNNKYKEAKYYEVLKKSGYALFALCNEEGDSVMLGDGDEVDFIGLIQSIAYVVEDEKLAKLVAKYPIREEVYFKFGDVAQDYLNKFKELDFKVDIRNLPFNSEFYNQTYSYNMDEAGYYMKKSNKIYLSFQNGNMGYGHGHYDNLHVNLQLNGKKILVDSGRYTYVNENKYRKEFKINSAHNGPCINTPNLKYDNAWENIGFYDTLPIKRIDYDEVCYMESTYMPSFNAFCTRRIIDILDEVVIISDYSNEDFNINYKFYDKYEKNNDKLLVKDFSYKVFGSDQVEYKMGEIAPKYNVLKEVSTINIKQKSKLKVFSFWGPENMQVNEFKEFEYIQEKRLKQDEKMFQMYEIKFKNKKYVYGENKYISGNCNNSIVLKGIKIMANIFVMDIDTKKVIILKR